MTWLAECSLAMSLMCFLDMSPVLSNAGIIPLVPCLTFDLTQPQDSLCNPSAGVMVVVLLLMTHHVPNHVCVQSQHL